MKKISFIIIIIIICIFIGKYVIQRKNFVETTDIDVPDQVENLLPQNPDEIVDDVNEDDDKQGIRSENVEYIVQEGDVLGLIADAFSLKISTIIVANNLNTKAVIKPGQTLIILPADGIDYTIKSGDTLLQLANKYQIDYEEILTFNELELNSPLKIGQAIFLPNANEYASAVTVAKKTTVTTKTISSKATVATGKITWTSGAISSLNRIPYNIRYSVKQKVNNYAKSHGITRITKAVYESIRI